MACFCSGGSKKEVDLIRKVEVLEERVRSILAEKDKAERRLNLEQLDRQRESNEAASALNHARVARRLLSAPHTMLHTSLRCLLQT